MSDQELREDDGTERPAASLVIRGARAVAERASSFAHLSAAVSRALVNGVPGALVAPGGRPFALLAFTVAGGRIVEIDVLSDPERLAALDLSVLDRAAQP